MCNGGLENYTVLPEPCNVKRADIAQNCSKTNSSGQRTAMSELQGPNVWPDTFT